MLERLVAYVTYGGGRFPVQVVIRHQSLHPTKGWRSNRHKIEHFEDVDAAFVRAREINNAQQ